MKTRKRTWRIAASMILFFMMITGTFTIVSEAAEVEVVHEDYDALPVNHVKIEELSLAEGELSSDSNSFKELEFSCANQDNGTYIKNRNIAYYGRVNWGSSNTTSDKDAVMSKTEIPGAFSLRFANKAVLSDGKKADVVFTFSNWEIWLGAKPDRVSASDPVYILGLQSDNTSKLILTTAVPRLDTNEDGALESTIKQRIKVTAKICEHGTDNPIDSEFDTMLIGFVDLDTPDKSRASSKDEEERYKGEFTESIELLSGYSSPILISAKDKTKTVIDIRESGVKVRGTAADNNTLDSGFICPVSPGGYSFYWYGSCGYNKNLKGLSCMGTKLAEMKNVSVGASSGQGGTIEKEGSTDYVLNSTTTYKYEPEKGFYVKSLTVDGDPADFDPDGGVYIFDKLTETDADGDDHTIDVKFEAYPEIEIEKSVSNETPETGDEIEYTIEMRQIKEGAVLKNAVMEDKIPDGLEVIEDSIDCSDDGEVTFEDNVITYTQEELEGDAVVSFRAVVTAETGNVKNVAVLSGDMADPVSDDAEIKIINADQKEPDQSETYKSDDDDREYHTGSSKKDPPDDEETGTDDEGYTGQPEDYDHLIPRTGDEVAGLLVALAGITITAFFLIYICVQKYRKRY